MYYNKRLSYEDALKAIGFFDKALEKDPDYAPALTGKAWGILNLGWSGAISREKVIMETSAIIKRAVVIDSSLSLAYSVSGWTKMIYEWDLDEAEKQFMRAYLIDPRGRHSNIGFSVCIYI
jgi:tetratricopeptide (TPR) repeat protein